MNSNLKDDKTLQFTIALSNLNKYIKNPSLEIQLEAVYQNKKAIFRCLYFNCSRI